MQIVSIDIIALDNKYNNNMIMTVFVATLYYIHVHFTLDINYYSPIDFITIIRAIQRIFPPSDSSPGGPSSLWFIFGLMEGSVVPGDRLGNFLFIFGVKESDFSSFLMDDIELGLDRLSATSALIVKRSALSLLTDFFSVLLLLLAGESCGVLGSFVSILLSIAVKSPYEELLGLSL